MFKDFWKYWKSPSQTDDDVDNRQLHSTESNTTAKTAVYLQAQQQQLPEIKLAQARNSCPYFYLRQTESSFLRRLKIWWFLVMTCYKWFFVCILGQANPKWIQFETYLKSKSYYKILRHCKYRKLTLINHETSDNFYFN